MDKGRASVDLLNRSDNIIGVINTPIIFDTTILKRDVLTFPPAAPTKTEQRTIVVGKHARANIPATIASL